MKSLDPKPGSDEATAAGCRCPVLDNSYGRGRYGDGEKYGWWMNETCPLHGRNTPSWHADKNE